MNRRHFFTTLAKAAAGFAILPSATTYTRRWSGLLVPQDYDSVITCEITYVASTIGWYQQLKNCQEAVVQIDQTPEQKAFYKVLFGKKYQGSGTC